MKESKTYQILLNNIPSGNYVIKVYTNKGVYANKVIVTQ
ncbi:MAG: T9SS type A sorting domain-containing protein [Bacteroidales bacterium]|nr:T9SS type A sorting domain-containing protein [Bacteroidales bacterium]